MALASEVLLNVRANTTQAVKELDGVALSLRTIRQDLAMARRDFNAGKISVEDFTTAERVARQQTLQFAVANGQLAQRASILVGVLAGVNTTAARFAVTMATMFGTGGGVLLGILAVATAFTGLEKIIAKLTEKARAAKKEFADLIATQAKAWREANLDPRPGQLAALDQRRKELAAAIQTMMTAPPGFSLAGMRTDVGDLLTQLRDANRAYMNLLTTMQGSEAEKAREALKALIANVNELLTSRGYGMRVTGRVGDLLAAERQLVAVWSDQRRALEDRNKAYQTWLDLQRAVWGPMLGQHGNALAIQGLPPTLRQTAGPEYAQQAPDVAGLRMSFWQRFAPNLLELRDAWQQWGDWAGRAFSQTFADVITGASIWRSLKRLLHDVVYDAVYTAINSAIGKFSQGAGASIGDWLFTKLFPFSLSQAAPTGLGGAGESITRGGGLNLSVNVPAPNNPFAWARDAQWQAALRESLLVARAGGFR